LILIFLLLCGGGVYDTWYLSGFFSLVNVGSGFHCLLSLPFCYFHRLGFATRRRIAPGCYCFSTPLKSTKLATILQVLIVEDGTIKDFPGDFEDYRNLLIKEIAAEMDED
jgi:hypothetical protein